ncbi:MAG: hypothetical protein DMD62_07030 [Gemmatimonadetes bacterium]|nr:MAG: hypothetical protein DMD62_07030 [Gemmatimonadota bacterium]
MRRLRDGKSLLLEKPPVCGEAVDFVVDPENTLRTRHRARQASPAGEAGQRDYIARVLRILCVRFSSIGDVLLTTPLVRALHRRHPDAELYYVTKRALAPLVVENPHLTRVIELDPAERITDLARRLRSLGATHGLDLHGSMRSLALRWLVPCRWSGYSKRRLARTTLIATKIDMYGRHVPVPERYFEAARALDVTPDGGPPEFFLAPASRAHMKYWLAEVGIADKPFAVIAPGAAHATKRWPVAHWQALTARLEQLGYSVVAVGGPADRELARTLGGRVINVAGELTLQETGACLARAAVVVSGDTGVMHMATGVGTHVVALFGPTVEPFGFFPYTTRATVLERDMDCRPCSAMGTARCPLGHHRCLEEILPDEVAAAVQRLVA